jgi:hypothetical protein
MKDKLVEFLFIECFFLKIKKSIDFLEELQEEEQELFQLENVAGRVITSHILKMYEEDNY